MQGHHARATTAGPRLLHSVLSRPGGLVQERARGAKHRRSTPLRGRWRRRILAYRDIELLQSPAPQGRGAWCLLLVHIRKVVGQVTFRVCDECAAGVITGVVIEDQFQDSGLGTRALSHLRARYPDLVWRTTLERRVTRDLFRRMRIAATASDAPCSHARA
ncbi:hypothetical protein [Streptomyces sp. NPDC050856]|uniref:hypothetical protein n=1 Tax=Streptomyces sp. NPDC050856 TaxID=3154939 RepID=UPI0033E88404